jgi:hypothetical protein
LRLIDASAPLKSWHVNSGGSATLLFEARGELASSVPISCALSMGGKPLTPRREGPHSIYAVSADNASGEFQLEC